jgi:hypothetical protein
VCRVAEHSLGELIVAAADGCFPAVDGWWRRMPLWCPGWKRSLRSRGMRCFAVECDVPDPLLEDLGADGFSGAHHPRLIHLSGWARWMDRQPCHAAGRLRHRISPLVDRPDLAAHPRAAFAGIRDGPPVMGYPDPGRSDLAVISTGIGGLTEISFELETRPPGKRRRRRAGPRRNGDDPGRRDGDDPAALAGDDQGPAPLRSAMTYSSESSSES